ncbi:hypothetical protein EYF80_057782 [Liparis tanakae]|uniref:Uncharacterized protein n=1 Tax=Liparis tanakae TaxID=230148 RepID=A0A4Z2ETC1_9TELE|nr:hypothetical protein EYF80_057782 [Liparis tanakae]
MEPTHADTPCCRPRALKNRRLPEPLRPLGEEPLALGPLGEEPLALGPLGEEPLAPGPLGEEPLAPGPLRSFGTKNMFSCIFE